tara:strand:- start:2678 stop:3004 length:327 start_codon:yes stop_codon:yes gene_type:complete
MDMNTGIKLATKWVEVVGLSKKTSNVNKSLKVFTDEVTEFVNAVQTKGAAEVMDEGGDCVIALNSFFVMHFGFDLSELMQHSTDKIYSRVAGGKMVNGKFTKKEDLDA